MTTFVQFVGAFLMGVALGAAMGGAGSTALFIVGGIIWAVGNGLSRVTDSY